MFLLITFLVFVTSICYLSQVAESPTKYEDFAAPLIVMFFYSLICLRLAWKNLVDKDNEEIWRGSYYNDYNGNRYRTGYRNSGPAVSSNRTYNNTEYTSYAPPKPLETVEKFIDDKPKERNITEKVVIKTYPDRKKVEAEIKRLKRNPFWRAKRGICGVFGVDITDKLYQPKEEIKYVTKKRAEIHSSIFTNESSYNLILNKVGRSFDVTINNGAEECLTENTLTYGGEEQTTGNTESSPIIVNL